MYHVFLSLLQKKGVSAYQVAKATGISPTVFSDWKSGKSTPKVDKLKKLAAYFGVSLDEMIAEKEAANAQRL